MPKPKAPCILYVSSFPPRECGIATFTEDLTNAIDKEFNPGIKSKILAINDNGTSIYNYPRKVIMQINESEMDNYIKRAYEINERPEIKLVNIQHEYGLFGGEQGEYLMPFLELLKKPFIITMHTVLPEPDEKMQNVGRIISEKAKAVVVMTKTAKDILSTTYGIDPEKIHIIPHGVHHIPFPSKSRAKRKLNLSGRLVLSTFGMISRDKGIEYAIEALPKIVEKYPQTLYLILGATHPSVRREEGENYRNKLKKLVEKHKLENNVKFYNRYLDLSELIDYLKATDIYIYPMLSREQASSGSLSYAMSCGCPTIATKSQYALSVLNDERGRLVRFRNSEDIEKALLELIKNKSLRKEMKQNTYFYTRQMTWQNVALSYFSLFNEYAKIVPREKDKIPHIKLDYIKNLTDKFAMIQFAVHTKPDLHSGYCLDDNARALLGCVKAYELNKRKSTLFLIEKYLDFIQFVQKENGKYYNFVNYQRNYTDNGESEDSFGRAIWGLGVLIASPAIPRAIKEKADAIFRKSLKWLNELGSLRAIAFAIIGLSEVIKHEDRHELKKYVKQLADKLVQRHQAQSEASQDANWAWFEDCLTYSNYKLPEAMFRAYDITGSEEYKAIAEKSLRFLNKVTFETKEFFSPIGQDGWYFRNGKRSYYDQQPEDAATAVECLAKAFEITKNKEYQNKSWLAFQWFLGKNHLNQMVYDEATGGCYDGLGKFSLNFNQGAESSLSYFLARLAIERVNQS